MSAPGPMLELERVETYRGPAQILRSISLVVGAGEAVCLVGRNGAGKTTTIDTIMGLLPPRAGSVRFKGRDVTRLRAHERARLGIGYAPEDAGIFPELTVQENFQIGRWMARPARRGRASSMPCTAASAGCHKAPRFLACSRNTAERETISICRR